MGLRSWLYQVARIMGDIQAIQKGPQAITKRIERRLVGRLAGKIIGKLTK